MKHVILVVLALLHVVFADQIDPPIPCREDAECVRYSKMPESTCKEGYCLCKNGTVLKNCSITEITQNTNRNIGPHNFHTCKHDQECQIPRTLCNTTISQCVCQRGFVLSSNKQQCLQKAVYFGFPCIDEKQCTSFSPNSTCHDNLCTCVMGYHLVNETCHRTVEMGHACIKTEECSHVVGAVCTERKVCDCAAETVLNAAKQKCLPAAREIFQNCVEDRQCTTTFENSLCIDRQCQCRDQFHYESNLTRCVVNRGLDENCGNSYECFQNEETADNLTVKAMECRSNKCVCAEDYYREEDRCVNAGSSFVEFSPLLVFSILCYALSSW